MKCPRCKKPGELHLVFVDGVKDGQHCGWQEYELCHTCGGTNEISEERARWIEHGKRLRAERLAEPYETQREAAKRLGVDYPKYTRVEAGREPL